MINKDILETLYKEDKLPLLFASLISADNLVDADSCRFSLYTFYDMEKEFPNTDIPEEHWKDFVEKGISICKRDLYHFLEADNDEFEYGHNVVVPKLDDDCLFEV